MMGDKVTQLLRDVERGAVSVEDARNALEGVDLSEDDYIKAVEPWSVQRPQTRNNRKSIDLSIRRFMASNSSGPLGDYMDPVLGGNVILWAIQQMGSAAAIFPPRHDITHANHTGHSLPSVRNA